MADLVHYAGREQSYVKHVVLERYLERFAHIIGSWKNSITYVDGFSGPWNAQSKDFSDSSFGIALNELRKAQKHLLEQGHKSFKIRCFFVEETPKAFKELKAFTDKITDAEIRVSNSTFEEAIPDIISFIKKGRIGNFPFILIDPKGWKGFSMNVIKPLIELNPCEVVVNFMTEHIKRFIEWDNQANQEQFKDLFGNAEYRELLKKYDGFDREYAAAEFYAQSLGIVGKFPYICKAMVLNPQKDKTHYHLIYASRKSKGVEVFKKAEKAAMEKMESARAKAKQRSREIKTGQGELLPAFDLHDQTHFNQLRDYFIEKAKKEVRILLIRGESVSYDILWAKAMTFPLVWESNLKEWLKEWEEQGLNYQNRPSTKLGLKPGKNINVIWPSA